MDYRLIGFEIHVADQVSPIDRDGYEGLMDETHHAINQFLRSTISMLPFARKDLHIRFAAIECGNSEIEPGEESLAILADIEAREIEDSERISAEERAISNGMDRQNEKGSAT